MQLSLRSLMLFIAAVCVSLALTRTDFVQSGFVLMAIIILANITLSKHAWRCGAYGALAGILAAFVIMLVYIDFEESRATTLGDANLARIRIFENWRGYVIPIGALAGGTLGFILFGAEKTTESVTSRVEPPPEM